MELASKNEIPILDLTDTFKSNYLLKNQKFEFDIDGHWNQHGHLVAGKSISTKIVELDWIKDFGKN